MNAKQEEIETLEARIEQMSTTLTLGEVPNKYMAQFKTHRESLIRELEDLRIEAQDEE